MSDPGRLLLAVELDGDGGHPASWRYSGRPPGAVLTAAALRSAVAAAEGAGFTLATFADSPVPPGGEPDAAGRLEAGTRAAFSAVLTDRIGLAPALHATTTEPFHLATQLASLDYASHGRAAWVVGAANSAEARATVGAASLSPAALHREVTDVIDTARLLWDSWQDDAVIKDLAAGRYLDSDRIRHVDFEGASFSVKGPLITPRPPQGQVVVITPDYLFADDRADAVLVAGPDLAAIRERAGQARQAGAPLVLAEVEVLLDTAAAPAAERAAQLDETTSWPDTGRLRHAGPAAGLIGLLDSLAGLVDGVRLHPAVLAADLPGLIADVLPALIASGRHVPPAPGQTLRASLGLPRPANRLAVTVR
jgi:alkanesulfonate monooxygenase SsuD/methylene tetrahydromethanopterin reductase-like flavin-dependent oxidoreductase (luciferase family)